MARKQHLSRLVAPKSWRIKRKGIKWVVKQRPGPHNNDTSIPLTVLIRDVLKLATNARAVKYLLNSNQIYINNKVKKDPRFPVGILDVISIPALKKHYRIVLDEFGKIIATPIPEKEANIIILKVRNKVSCTKNKTQLNFTNGWNLIVDKDVYSTNDVLVFDLNKNKPIKHIVLKEGVMVYFLNGKRAGSLAKLKSISETGRLRKQKVAVVIADKKEWETLVDNFIIVGEAKPIITLK